MKQRKTATHPEHQRPLARGGDHARGEWSQSCQVIWHPPLAALHAGQGGAGLPPTCTLCSLCHYASCKLTTFTGSKQTDQDRMNIRLYAVQPWATPSGCNSQGTAVTLWYCAVEKKFWCDVVNVVKSCKCPESKDLTCWNIWNVIKLRKSGSSRTAWAFHLFY